MSGSLAAWHYLRQKGLWMDGGGINHLAGAGEGCSRSPAGEPSGASHFRSRCNRGSGDLANLRGEAEKKSAQNSHSVFSVYTPSWGKGERRNRKMYTGEMEQNRNTACGSMEGTPAIEIQSGTLSKSQWFMLYRLLMRINYYIKPLNIQNYSIDTMYWLSHNAQYVTLIIPVDFLSREQNLTQIRFGPSFAEMLCVA